MQILGRVCCWCYTPARTTILEKARPRFAVTFLDLSFHQDNNATAIILEALGSGLREVKPIQLCRAKVK